MAERPNIETRSRPSESNQNSRQDQSRISIVGYTRVLLPHREAFASLVLEAAYETTMFAA